MGLSTDSRIWKGMALILAVLTIFFVLLFFFRIVLITFAVGISLIVFTEQLRRFYKKQFDRRRLSVNKRRIYGALIIIFWTATIIFIFYLSVDQLTQTLAEVTEQGVNPEAPLATIITQQFEAFVPEGFRDYIDLQTAVRSGISFMVNSITTILRGLTSFILVSVIVVPLLYFIYYKRGRHMTETVASFVPEKFRPSYEKAKDEVSAQLYDFLTGKVTQIVVIGALYCLGFYIIGVKGWLLFGVIAGLLNIVPYIGPIISAIPPLLITLLTEPALISLLVVVVALIAQGIDNFYLQPFMLAGKVKIGALLSIVLVIVGAQLFGVLGMIFALPVYIIYKVVLKESYIALCGIYDKKALPQEIRSG